MGPPAVLPAVQVSKGRKKNVRGTIYSDLKGDVCDSRGENNCNDVYVLFYSYNDGAQWRDFSLLSLLFDL